MIGKLGPFRESEQHLSEVGAAEHTPCRSAAAGPARLAQQFGAQLSQVLCGQFIAHLIPHSFEDGCQGSVHGLSAFVRRRSRVRQLDAVEKGSSESTVLGDCAASRYPAISPRWMEHTR